LFIVKNPKLVLVVIDIRCRINDGEIFRKIIGVFCFIDIFHIERIRSISDKRIFDEDFSSILLMKSDRNFIFSEELLLC